MYDFWENILFATGNFNGNPMQKHKELHQKSAMNQSHFQHWIAIFSETVDDLFAGLKATEMKQRALNIATVMMCKTLEL
jgi:hemoglobin